MEYVKLIIRRFARNRVYTIINIGGLAIALTVALLIYSHVVKEWQTDRFHVGGEHIYRVTCQHPGYDYWSTEFCSPMVENAGKEIPGVKDYVRLVAPQSFLVKNEQTGEFFPEDRCIYTDPQFFSVLSFPLIAGTVDSATGPAWAVLSERITRKYFGNEPAVGQTLTLRYPEGPEEMNYQVVAVMKDMPDRSSIQADILLDFRQIEELYLYGAGNALTTLLELEPQADITVIENEIPVMEGRYSEYEKEQKKIVRLQPLRDIYLSSGHIRDYEDVFSYGSFRFDYVLGGIALLILILASCNYLMIKMAQLHKNGAVFAIQRCFGAGDRTIRRQVFMEIAMHTGLALGIAIGLFFTLHPYFVGIVSPQHVYALTLTKEEWVLFGMLIIVFVLGLGYLLSLWLLKRLDRNGIKRSIKPVSGVFDLKQGLLVGQMCIFCGLLFASVVLVKQMNFVRHKPIGFDNRNVLCVEWPGDEDIIYPVKEALLNHPDISAVTNGRPLPIGNWVMYDVYDVEKPDRKIRSSALLGDTSYLQTYRMRLLEGRNYRKKWGNYFGVVQQGEVVINRKMVQELGLKNPVGTVLNYGPSTLTVVGVVEDFHYQSLYQPVNPVLIGADLVGYDSNLNIRYREGKRQAVLDYLRNYFKENCTGIMMQYTEYSYSDLYARDIALVKMIHILTVLAILISGMGIFAFSMFVAESRTKEIAMRKISGATEIQVIGLLNRSFISKMAVACLAGIPVAYYAMHFWLQGFAYRTTVNWWLFAVDVGVSIALVVSISSWQSWRAASVNPVDALKDE
ncbi:ABC transporter permease [uncultured Culturomica sp.]|uniref:ABC transporter permease n=1 Tax=uncultured Culturomica sp. TaxID=1926654 RepID=UPI000340FA0D|nr:ABC transporter permease [uncultured Culturomica sp.]CCZ07951.1 putative uncharacterized protein [Odoribacter sp. CAG:788]